MQEGNEKSVDFGQLLQNYMDVIHDSIGLGEQVRKEPVQILLKFFRQDFTLLSTQLHKALFTGMGFPV